MIGAVVFKAGPTVPSGFLAANGQAVSRSTYAALFAEIGTAWGTGDGTTTFNLPDLRGRVPVAAGQGTGLTDRVLATIGGAETVTLSVNEMPLHGHPVRRANVAQSSASSQTSGGYLTNTSSNVNDPAHTGTPSRAIKSAALVAAKRTTTCRLSGFFTHSSDFENVAQERRPPRQ